MFESSCSISTALFTPGFATIVGLRFIFHENGYQTRSATNAHIGIFVHQDARSNRRTSDEHPNCGWLCSNQRSFWISLLTENQSHRMFCIFVNDICHTLRKNFESDRCLLF